MLEQDFGQPWVRNFTRVTLTKGIGGSVRWRAIIALMSRRVAKALKKALKAEV